MRYDLTENSRANFIAYAPMHTFKGWITQGMKGGLDINFEKMELGHIEASALTEYFDTGYPDRNKVMVDFFDWEKNPLTSFTMTECLEFEKIGDSLYKLTVLGILDFAGIKRQLPIRCNMRHEANRIWLDLKFKWSFKAYGIKAPRLLFLTVRDIVDISSSLEFTLANEG